MVIVEGLYLLSFFLKKSNKCISSFASFLIVIVLYYLHKVLLEDLIGISGQV